jgi:hypothetical protein
MTSEPRRLSLEQRKSHFRNLVFMALADGKLEQGEKTMLSLLGFKWGLQREEVAEIMMIPDSIPVNFPDDPGARVNQLYDLVELMIIDGVMGSKEKELCVSFAKGLNFAEEAVKIVADEIIAANRRNESEQVILERLRGRLL